MPVSVVVRDLWKSYGSVEAVRGVSFQINSGEIFGLLGPNGAGKTTVLECLVGLQDADSGELEICGVDVRRLPQAAKQRIGVVLQGTALPDQITPREALALFGSFYQSQVEPQALLERFDLGDKAGSRFATLSGGQRQRLALALALVNSPEVILMDEPTNGLDPQARRELHDEIAQMKQQGCAVLLTTHQLAEAERLCDRIAILDHGRVVATGTPQELIGKSAGLPLITLVTSRPLDRGRLAGLPGVQDLECAGVNVRFRTADVNTAVAELMKGLAAERIEIMDLHVRKGSIEDVFLGITSAGAPGKIS